MKKLRITVGKNTYDVTVEVLEDDTPHVVQPVRDRPAESAPQPTPQVAHADSTRDEAAPGSITSPMAGTVKSIRVKVGDAVEQGQEVAILEAMKMENQISAPHAGHVKSVDVAEGESVGEGQVLLTIQ